MELTEKECWNRFRAIRKIYLTDTKNRLMTNKSIFHHCANIITKPKIWLDLYITYYFSNIVNEPVDDL